MGGLIDVNIDKDAFGLSKPLTKLIEVVRDGVKGVAAPWQIKRITKAQSESNKIALLAEIEMAKISSQEWGELLGKRELRQMQNINNVVALAAQNLADEEYISDEEVDPDWAAIFFDFVEKISKEDLQVLWGKILSEEIKQPNSFYVRTLQTIFFLSKEETSAFISLTKYVFNESVILFDSRLPISERLLDFPEVEIAITLGLVNPMTVTHKMIVTQKSQTCIGNRDITLILANDSSIEISITGLVLTEVGIQLFKLARTAPTLDILEYYKNYIEKKYSITVCIN